MKFFKAIHRIDPHAGLGFEGQSNIFRTGDVDQASDSIGQAQPGSRVGAVVAEGA